MKALVMLICLAVIGTSSAKLKLLQVTFRHGDRSPDKGFASYYPKDPYINETWFPEGWGSLTNAGKLSAYSLGEFLRQRYSAWLGDIYSKELIQVRSSNYERTKMTAQLVAFALFPPNDIQRWHPTQHWQPIPVWSEPVKEDPLFLSLIICSNFKKMITKLEATDDFLLSQEEELRDFYEFISKHTGANSTRIGIFVLYHQLYGQLSHGVKLPEWTNDIFPEGKLEEVASFFYVIQSYNNELKKLNGGQWIREWLMNVDGYLDGMQTEGRKVFLYSGHEINVAAILSALNVFKPHVPSYSSAVLFELHEEHGDFCVKVIYRNKEIVQEVFVPGCDSICCQLNTFRKLFADIVVADPMSLCGAIN